jgi:hypothetical protein
MTTTITFRLPAAKRAKLRQKAKLFGKTESEFLREILDREIDDRPMSVRVAKLKGVLSFKNIKMDARRQAIRDNNWRS